MDEARVLRALLRRALGFDAPTFWSTLRRLTVHVPIGFLRGSRCFPAVPLHGDGYHDGESLLCAMTYPHGCPAFLLEVFLIPLQYLHAVLDGWIIGLAVLGLDFVRALCVALFLGWFMQDGLALDVAPASIAGVLLEETLADRCHWASGLTLGVALLAIDFPAPLAEHNFAWVLMVASYFGGRLLVALRVVPPELALEAGRFRELRDVHNLHLILAFFNVVFMASEWKHSPQERLAPFNGSAARYTWSRLYNETRIILPETDNGGGDIILKNLGNVMAGVLRYRAS
jgi:hypothetical protein